MRLIAVTAWLMLSLGGSSEAQESPPGSAAALDSATATSQLAQAAWDRNTKEGTEEAIRLYGKAAEQYQRAREAEQQAQMLMNVAYLHTTLGHADTALARYRQLLRLLDETKQLALLARARADRRGAPRPRGTRLGGLLLPRVPLDDTEGRRPGDGGTRPERHRHGDKVDKWTRRSSTWPMLEDPSRASDTLGQGVTLNNLAALLQILGDPDSALASLRESLVLRRAAKDRAGEATTLNNIAYSFERLKQPDSARFYRQALAILQEMGQCSREGVTLSNMGRVFLAMERADSSRVYLERGLTSAREVGDHIAEGWTLIDLGRWYESAGEPDTALARLGQALAALRGAGDRAFEVKPCSAWGRRHMPQRGPGSSRGGGLLRLRGHRSGRSRPLRRRRREPAQVREQDVELFERWGLAWLARAAEVGPDRAAGPRWRQPSGAERRARSDETYVRSRSPTRSPRWFPRLTWVPRVLAWQSPSRVQLGGALLRDHPRHSAGLAVLLSGEVTIVRQPVGQIPSRPWSGRCALGWASTM